MADDLDQQLDAAYQTQVSDAALEAAYASLTGGPAHNSMLKGLVGQAVHAGSLHADAYFTSPEWQAKNKRFEKENPIKSGVAQAAGFVLPMLTPAGAVSRVPAAVAKVADWVLPFANFTRAVAPGAKARTVLNQSGMGSLKAGAMMRANDPVETEKTGDATIDTLQNIAARGRAAGDPWKLATDYGIGAPAGWAGNKIASAIGSRLGDVGQKATLGNMPNRGAVLDIAHEIKHDSPTGSVKTTIDSIRDLVYGSERTLARRAGGAIPQDAEREMARQFHKLTAEKGLTDSQAERVLGRYWGSRASTAEKTMRGGSPSEDAWLLANRGNAYKPATMGQWGRAAGTNYRSNNAIPSNLTELTALASGGEAPALQSTLRKLLNLKSEGGARSGMLRTLRDRQKAIGPLTENILRRYRGGGDVAETIGQHTSNAQNANALYPEIISAFNAHPEAPAALQSAIKPVLQGARAALGAEDDAIARAVLEHAAKFENKIPVPAQGSETPLRSAVTKTLKDAQGNVIGKEQRQVPLTKITTEGQEVSTKINPGGKMEDAIESTGSLESFIRRRRVLQDAIDTAYRGGSKQMGHALKELKDQLDEAVRGLGAGSPPKGSVGEIMQKWVAANDTRAMAGQLERTYQDALSLNLTAKKGEGLMDLERFHGAFRRMDPANKDMARRGILDQFVAMLQGKGDMHDTAKIFSNPRTRRILSEIIGPEATEEFGGFVARAGLATNTFNMNKGSQTASILDTDKGSGWLASIAGALWHGNPLRALGHAGEAAGDYLKRQKHAEMTRLLSADTRNPQKIEAVLETLRRAAAPINQRLQALESQGRRAGMASGIFLGARQPGE